MFHIPVREIIHFLIKLKNNRLFLQISRFLFLSLIALSSIGHNGEWIEGFEPNSIPCIAGKYECYQGIPLFLNEFITKLGASHLLYLLPLINILAVLVILLKLPRAYLSLFLLYLFSIVVDTLSEPTPYMYHLSGIGKELNLLAVAFLLILSIPLALDEQMTLYPNYDYEGILKYF